MPLHGREAAGGLAYARHRPEETQLYRLVEQHYPAFVAHLTEQGKALPRLRREGIRVLPACGRLEHGFLRVRCESCHFERLIAFSCKKRGFCPSCGARRMAETAALLVTHLAHKAGFTRKEAATGAVTLVQRFGSALNLNIHLHVLCLDGVYALRPDGSLRFTRVKAPAREEDGRWSAWGRKALRLRTITPLAGVGPRVSRPGRLDSVGQGLCSAYPSGYRFLGEQDAAIDALNPLVAARLLVPLTR